MDWPCILNIAAKFIFLFPFDFLALNFHDF